MTMACAKCVFFIFLNFFIFYIFLFYYNLCISQRVHEVARANVKHEPYYTIL